MRHLDISINGRLYQIACDDGQEAHVRALAADVEGRLRALVKAVGQVGDDRLLLMTALLIADELSEARKGSGAARPPGDGLGTSAEALAETIEALAARIETIADRLERA